MNRALFAKGVDAWWMDATEPDLLPAPTLDGQHQYMNPTAMGPGSRVLNSYALMMAQLVYDGQRSVAPEQRVFTLTRSGFAGQQRYAAASWSGDTSATWTAMRKQIPAGLGFCMTGIPYWTMDVGGFSVPARFSSKEATPQNIDEWREMCTRWFQFGTFCPLLRVHGEFPFREMWEFGGEQSPAYLAQLKFDRLRYRLLPYIYSLAGEVTRNGGTMMRDLVMDFPDDSISRQITDQYMFGPAFLVSPITEYQARKRTVYLPPGKGWYDFWTGRWAGGAKYITAPAPYDQIPLHIRAGSIIPFGPELQYTGEKPADPITLYVYAGADGDFNLYEDDGLTYLYEKGGFSLIPIHWDERSGTLSIGPRQGAFAGMLQQRTFNIIFVTKDKPNGFSFEPVVDRTVTYDGQAVAVRR
jgi:alpha-D-xyloside xylohydrolase